MAEITAAWLKAKPQMIAAPPTTTRIHRSHVGIRSIGLFLSIAAATIYQATNKQAKKACECAPNQQPFEIPH